MADKRRETDRSMEATKTPRQTVGASSDPEEVERRAAMDRGYTSLWRYPSRPRHS
jgi:hypothetical protein